MPDNLDTAASTLAPLPGHEVIRLQGPDAVAFAQAQFANDVPALAVGRWQWSAWLTAKGRVIALFQLYRAAEDALMLILADGHAAELSAELRRFVFRRKLTIAPEPGLEAVGALAAPARAHGPDAAVLEDGSVEFDLGADGLPRRLRLRPRDPVVATPDDPAAALRWRQADLRLGLPRLDDSQREQWTPQQIGLDRLQAYSVKKGCYPGQEIVARTHFLGKAKRLAQLLEVPPGTAPGDDVLQQGQRVGAVASVAGGLALAVLPLELGEAGLEVRGTAARPQPLVEGLAR